VPNAPLFILWFEMTIKTLSIIIALFILWFSGSGLYAIAMGKIVHRATFYSFLILLVTAISLFLTRNLEALLIGVISILILSLSIHIVGLITPSATIKHIGYFLISSASVYFFLKLIVYANKWKMSKVYILGYLMFFLITIFINILYEKNFLEEKFENYK